MNKKILIILILFVTSCGYQPIYINKDPSKLIFKSISLNGDKELNRKILNALSIKKDENIPQNKSLTLSSSINILETSKNSKGQVETYKSIVSVDLLIEEDDKQEKRKNFLEDFTYNNYDNKFELVEYQEEVELIILNKIIEKISIYINL